MQCPVFGELINRFDLVGFSRDLGSHIFTGNPIPKGSLMTPLFACNRLSQMEMGAAVAVLLATRNGSQIRSHGIATGPTRASDDGDSGQAAVAAEPSNMGKGANPLPKSCQRSPCYVMALVETRILRFRNDADCFKEKPESRSSFHSWLKG